MGKKGNKVPSRTEKYASTQAVNYGEAGICYSETLSLGRKRSPKPLSKRQLSTIQHRSISGARIYIFKDVLLPEECANLISCAEQTGFAQTDQVQTREYAQRNNGRYQMDDSAFADQLFERIQHLLPRAIDGRDPVGCSDNIRLYRYSEGQSFGRHVDESNFDKRLNGQTMFTLLIYLNSHCSDSTDEGDGDSEYLTGSRFLPTCTGGQTVFYTGPGDRSVLLEVVPEAGTMLLHGHGARCLTHESRVVTQGVKYVLRTDVVYR